MAHAPDVLHAAIDEAALLVNSEGTLEQIGPLILLARQALDAGNGEVPDEDVRSSGIHPTKLRRLGLLD